MASVAEIVPGCMIFQVENLYLEDYPLALHTNLKSDRKYQRLGSKNVFQRK